MKRLSAFLVFALAAIFANAQSFEVKASIDLPQNCFTQGFLKHQQRFYLSCGRYQHSKMYLLSAKGNIIKQQTLPSHIFAEGISVYQNQLWLLTWKAEHSFPLNLQTLNIGKPIKNTGQGWGLTQYQDSLVQSNGSNFLYTVKPNNKAMQKLQSHFIAGHFWLPINKINELEQLPGFIAANIWQKPEIVFIALPLKKAQRIAFRLNLQTLTTKHQHQGVLNGIAFDKQTGCLWVTGKMWPKAYALAINHPKLTLACNIQP